LCGFAANHETVARETCCYATLDALRRPEA